MAKKNLEDYFGEKKTVEVMNMSRYRYRPVTSPLPFWALRYPTLLNVIPTLPTVTDRY